MNEEGAHNFAMSCMLFLTPMREKYVKMYERFIEELKTYSKAIKILSKGYLAIYLLPLSKLEKILKEVRKGNHQIEQELCLGTNQTVFIL